MGKKLKKVNWKKMREFLKANPEIDQEIKGREMMHYGRAKREFKEALREAR